MAVTSNFKVNVQHRNARFNAIPLFARNHLFRIDFAGYCICCSQDNLMFPFHVTLNFNYFQVLYAMKFYSGNINLSEILHTAIHISYQYYHWNIQLSNKRIIRRKNWYSWLEFESMGYNKPNHVVFNLIRCGKRFCIKLCTLLKSISPQEIF